MKRLPKLSDKLNGSLTPCLFPFELKVVVTNCWVAIVPGTKEKVFGLWKTKAAARKQSPDVRRAKVTVEILP